MSVREITQFVLVLMVVFWGVVPNHCFSAGEAGESALAKALAQAELFAGLSDADMSALAETAVLRQGMAGQRIVEQGKIQDRMFIILAGEANILVNGKQVVTLSGQSLVGEIEFLDGLPASADVVLVNETDLVELNNAALDGLMEKEPRLGYILMRRIARIECQRLRDSNPQ